MIFLKNRVFVTFLGVAICMLLAQDSFAQKIRDLFDKEMPQFERLSDEEFEELTFYHKDIPFGDQALAYEVRLPMDWSEPKERSISNMSLSSHLLGEIVTFYSPPRTEFERSKFQIKALRLDFETTAEQWLLRNILANGFTLEGLEYFDENKVGALHVYLDGGDTYVSRSLAQINGKRMILVEFIVPAENWEQEAPLIARSMETFKLLSPERNINIENMETHVFLDIAQFSYPESWKISTRAIRSVDKMEVSLNNFRHGDRTVLDGQIKVELVAAYIVQNLENEIESVKSEFRRKGLVINNFLESREDHDFSPEAEFGFLDVFTANDPNNSRFEYEVWIAVMAIQNHYVIVSMFTPGRDYDFFTWSRNASTFRSVTTSTKMQVRSISID
ncbi:MAG: hypothetical protein ACK4VI_08145 [Alphaproteobacteria bacterium]